MMNESSVISERRQRRSDDPTQAAQLYLEHLARRAGCEAIALSTHDGLLLGGFGEGYDLDLLGALAALGSQIGSYEPEQRHAARGQALRFYGLELYGHAVYVSSVGGGSLPVEECLSALRRIYGVLRPS